MFLKGLAFIEENNDVLFIAQGCSAQTTLEAGI